MTLEKKNTIWLLGIIGLIMTYYTWIVIWRNNEWILTTGGNLLSLAGASLPVAWIIRGFQKKYLQKKVIYWTLILLNALSYLLAEICWTYSETILRSEVSYPGIYDFFYTCSGIFLFLAFTYKIIKYSTKSLLVKFAFDIGIILAVTFTFTWHYILAPLIAQTPHSYLSLLMTLFYPVGDVLLILCVATLYLGGEFFFIYMQVLLNVHLKDFYIWLFGLVNG